MTGISKDTLVLFVGEEGFKEVVPWMLRVLVAQLRVG